MKIGHTPGSIDSGSARAVTEAEISQMSWRSLFACKFMAEATLMMSRSPTTCDRDAIPTRLWSMMQAPLKNFLRPNSLGRKILKLSYTTYAGVVLARCQIISKSLKLLRVHFRGISRSTQDKKNRESTLPYHHAVVCLQSILVEEDARSVIKDFKSR